MTARANQFRLQIAEMSAGVLSQPTLLRWALIITFSWVGAIQFTDCAADGIASFSGQIMSGMPALSGIRGASHVIGVFELATAALLALGVILPIYSVLGAALSAAAHLITLTVLLSAAGITETTAGGFPPVPLVLGQLLLKNLVLLAALLAALMASVQGTKSDARKS